MPMHIDERILADARRVNRMLAWAPRFRASTLLGPRIGQAVLRLGQLGADFRLRRRGIAVERLAARADGRQAPVRVLRPAGAVRGIVFDIHGGGWVAGNPQMNDQLNADIIAACGVAVVSVDYRLATGAPLEALIDDCLTAARWLLQDGLPDYAALPVVVVGESAGGHLAAVVLQALRRWPALLERIAGAVLYYGVYDMAGTPSVRSAGPDTLVLHGPGVLPTLRMLTPAPDDDARRHPSVSPLFGDLGGMPPALMVVGERDPLLDDTLEMARRWGEVAEVDLNLLPEAPHGFIHFPGLMGKAACAYTHAWINRRLAGSRAN